MSANSLRDINPLRKILLFLLILTGVYGCSNITKETHKAILDSEQNFIQKECSLNGFFQTEPEFFTFKNTAFCSAELEVLHIEHISEIESIVDYKITFKAKQHKLEKWLRAYESMLSRKIPSDSQIMVKDLIEQIATEKRDWVYSKQTVKMNLTQHGWIVVDVIR